MFYRYLLAVGHYMMSCLAADHPLLSRTMIDVPSMTILSLSYSLLNCPVYSF